MNNTGAIKAAEVVRNINGYWIHPDLDSQEFSSMSFLEQQMYFQARGVSLLFYEFLECATEEQCERYEKQNSCDVSYWRPPVPEREGCFLLAIFDSENGPTAVWAEPHKFPYGVTEEVLKKLFEWPQMLSLLADYHSVSETEASAADYEDCARYHEAQREFFRAEAKRIEDSF